MDQRLSIEFPPLKGYAIPYPPCDAVIGLIELLLGTRPGIYPFAWTDIGFAGTSVEVLREYAHEVSLL